MNGGTTEIGQHFIDESRAHLISAYLPKIRRCIEQLTDEDLWWRPNEQSNSVANLVLHLAGNIRQWVVSGIGGEADVRERQAEFDAEDGAGGRELLDLLDATMRDVDRVLADLDPAILLEPRVVQGTDVTVLRALYHAVEHFGMHTGQIMYITKLRTAADLGFYTVEAGIARPNW